MLLMPTLNKGPIVETVGERVLKMQEVSYCQFTNCIMLISLIIIISFIGPWSLPPLL